MFGKLRPTSRLARPRPGQHPAANPAVCAQLGPGPAGPFLQLQLSSPGRGSPLASSICLFTSASYVARGMPVPCCETEPVGRGDTAGIMRPFRTQAMTGLPGLLLVHPTLALS